MTYQESLFVVPLILSIGGYQFSNIIAQTTNSTTTSTSSTPTSIKNSTENLTSAALVASILITTSPPRTIAFNSEHYIISYILVVFSAVSSVCLIIYLKVSFNKKGTKTLLHKITCSYCLTLLMFYISPIISFVLAYYDHARFVGLLTLYLISSLFAWFLIISGELWLCFIYFRDYKVNYNKSNCNHMMEYCILCSLAWILPFGAPIYFFVSSGSSATKYYAPSEHLCLLPSDHRNRTTFDLKTWIDFMGSQYVCVKKQEFATFGFFLVIVLCLGHICIKFRALIREVENISVASSRTSKRRSFMIYAKLSCITGVFWLLSALLFAFNTEPNSLMNYISCMTYTLTITTHGILLYWSLGVKNSSLYSILQAHVNRNMILILPDNISMPHLKIRY